jgi:hypothetical protein
MAPHSEESNGSAKHSTSVDAVMGGTKPKPLKFPGPPVFENPYEERDYLKGRLAAAFRIFGKYGFDEGVAGHITVRVCNHTHPKHRFLVLTTMPGWDRILWIKTRFGSTRLV